MKKKIKTKSLKKFDFKLLIQMIKFIFELKEFVQYLIETFNQIN